MDGADYEGVPRRWQEECDYTVCAFGEGSEEAAEAASRPAGDKEDRGARNDAE